LWLSGRKITLAAVTGHGGRMLLVREPVRAFPHLGDFRVPHLVD
jgi:hypothetical protein